MLLNGIYYWNRDSTVSIATAYRQDDQIVRVQVPVGSRIFSSHHPDQLWGQPGLVSNGYHGILSPGVKWPGHEADHSPAISAKIKKAWIYSPIHLRSKKKLHGLSPLANYTDRATAACRRSRCQLLRIEGATWSAWQIPMVVFSVF
jgi:hypothetical protein